MLLATRVCVDALGPATDAWRQIVIFAALASIFLGAVAAYGQTNIKRLLAYSSINNVGFALVGLAAGGPRGTSSVLFYMAVYVVMTARRVPLRAVDARFRRASRSRPSPAFRACRRPGPASPRPSPSSCSASPAFRRCSASGPSCWCSTPRSQSGYVALAVAGILGTVIGAYYYLKIVKVMYMDDPAAPMRGSASRCRALLFLLAALIVSPLGYLLIGPLSALTDRAAGSLF